MASPTKNRYVATITVTHGRQPSATTQDFLRVYDTIRDQLLADPMMLDQPDTARIWFRKVLCRGQLAHDHPRHQLFVQQVLDYNVPGGKLNRGMAVLDALQAVKGANTVSWLTPSTQLISECTRHCHAHTCTGPD